MSVQFSFVGGQAAGVNAAQASAGATQAQMPQCLTAEGLLTYCQTMIGGIEDEINAMMEEQMQNMSRKSALSKVENAMKKHSPPKTEEDVQAIENAFNDAIDDLPADDPTRKALEEMKTNTLHALEAKAASGINGILGGERICMSKESWAGYIKDITSLKEDVSDNMQIGMLKLQSAVSKYQTCFQLTSNMTSTINKTALGIVNNVPRG